MPREYAYVKTHSKTVSASKYCQDRDFLKILWFPCIEYSQGIILPFNAPVFEPT